MKVKRRIAQGANIVIFAAPVLVLLASFFHGWLLRPADTVSGMLGLTAAHHALQRIVAVLLLFAAWNLHRWKRAAWGLCVILLAISLSISLILPTHYLGLAGFVVEAFVLGALIFARDLYVRPSERATVRRAALLAGGILVIVVLNVVITDLILGLRSNSIGQKSWVSDLATRVGNAIIGNGFTGSVTHQRLYDNFVFMAFWVTVACCLFLVLRSATVGRLITKEEKQRARDLVLRFGQNPIACLVLEDDKQLFFAQEVEGVVAYGMVGDAVIVSGDPVCRPEDFTQLLAEFKSFCQSMAVACMFLCTTDEFLDVYKQLGYGVTKCGEEAMFDLTEYSTAGGSAMKLRQKVHRAQKAGVTVAEYKPLQRRDREIEAAMGHITNQWLASKKSAMLGFTVGGNGLDDPGERRYFIARDDGGAICGYNVLLPFLTSSGERGYLVDVTRRLPSAPTGVTELLVVEGFRLLAADGVKYCSLGLATLAHVKEDPGGDTSDARLLDLFYNRMNRFYGFRDLYLAKKKYVPTQWCPRYFVHTGRRLSPQLVYSAIAIQNPRGLTGFLTDLWPWERKDTVEVGSASPSGLPILDG